MRVAWSIKAKISLLVLLLGLLLIVINQLRNEKLLAERSIARIEREAGETGTRLAGMMQHLFRKEQQRAAELEMSYASISTDLELGLVCDHDDVVRYATRLQWRGLNLKDTPLVSAARHVESSRGAMDGISIWDADHVRLLAVFPFFTSFDSKDRGTVYLANGKPFEYHNDSAKTDQSRNRQGWTTLGAKLWCRHVCLPPCACSCGSCWTCWWHGGWSWCSIIRVR